MKIFGKPYAEKFVSELSADAKTSFAAALDDNGDFLRIDLDLGPTALQETYEEDACVKCALTYGGKELQGVIHYATDEKYDFVSYEPQDAIRFWEIDAETCELVEILTHEDVTLQDLRIALGGGGGGGFDPSSIPEGDILQNTVLGLDEDGEIVKGDLFGKYVRLMGAPESTTLNDYQLNQIISGVFIKGTFLGLTNPVFYPTWFEDNNSYLGVVFGVGSGTFLVDSYAISKSNKVIVLSGYRFGIGGNVIKLSNIAEFNATGTAFKIRSLSLAAKNFPAYPADQTDKSYHFVLNNGTLEWHEGNGLFLHTVTFTVSGSSGNISLTILSDSATPIAFDSDTGNIVAEDSTFIQFANCGNFVFTRFGANGFNPTIYEFDTSTGAFSTQITLATVVSDTVTPIK